MILKWSGTGTGRPERCMKRSPARLPGRGSSRYSALGAWYNMLMEKSQNDIF
jgi:hypothetical protein